MYHLCTSEKATAQQRRLCSSFLSLLLKYPYDDITISHLCQEAGLSRNVFYRLFDKKADVLYALVDQAILDSQSYIPKSSVGPGGLHKFLAYWKDQKPLLDALARNQINSLLTERVILHVMQEEPDIVHSFMGELANSPREFLLFYISGLFSLVHNWHRQDYAMSIDEMAALLMTILVTPPVKAQLRSSPLQPEQQEKLKIPNL